MKVELSCSTQTATCNYSSLPGFSLPVSYLPGLPAAAAGGCAETESKGGGDKGMDRERDKEKSVSVCVYACVHGLTGEFHWRGA